MKFLLIVTLCSLAVCAKAYTEEEVKQFMEIVKKCKTETGASDDDEAAIMAHKSVDSHEGKCMGNCLMRKYNMIGSDGKMIKLSVLMAVSKMPGNDADKMKAAGPAIDSCSGVTHDDPCEYSLLLHTCLKAALEPIGIDF